MGDKPWAQQVDGGFWLCRGEAVIALQAERTGASRSMTS